MRKYLIIILLIGAFASTSVVGCQNSADTSSGDGSSTATLDKIAADKENGAGGINTKRNETRAKNAGLDEDGN